MVTTLNTGFILIVDDNPTNLSVLCEALNSEGFRFRVAVDGESAIAQVERHQPELILLDVQMPGIDGFETCRRLKANPVTQNIPVIFTTALSDVESKTKGFALGAVDYIPKPFAQEEVIARVRVHLQLKQLTESLEQQVSDRTVALQTAQVQLVQQEKLSTLGELIAGVAHEMNNPISFIANNLPPLEEYIAGVSEIIQLYQQEYPNPTSRITTAIKRLDLEFVLEDMVKILESLKVGSQRIEKISTSLRSFCRSDSDVKMPADLHEGLDSTLMILQHRLKDNGDRPHIEVSKTYGALPEVDCYVGQMNQVFMNILANAIDAIDEAIAQDKISDPIPQIQILTEVDSEQWVVIRIADNGMGVPESVQQRLFEPLFTTKPVGKGTGLGLSIAYQIVVDKHNGELAVNSQPSRGTEFIIKIPIMSTTV
ncbi:MAG: hybrid sensor histidine kinase/response regulator [Pelatocladus maniniholoensis HA4357-MV3]|jgi:signal transduction histidine kinase|uniref:histidine kinase n=1 Tax=Pelatocladus maniniholoensis HA4357-MV3 TaxID=1117104 RepID=A0A9E3LS13_9NOST|nr:hybrid sensor histidine kinase/response regulator [Pelatocladus maniniholoensis HA4357-MV3]BAZ65799.1 response regulator receiver sensor signal transduction histidine kinase [Fischerella sp. NIES-4106]